MICFPMNLRIRVKTQRIHKQIQSFFVNFRCEFCERSRLTASDPYRHGLIQRSQVVQTHFCYFLLAISMDFFFKKKYHIDGLYFLNIYIYLKYLKGFSCFKHPSIFQYQQIPSFTKGSFQATWSFQKKPWENPGSCWVFKFRCLAFLLALHVNFKFRLTHFCWLFM